MLDLTSLQPGSVFQFSGEMAGLMRNLRFIYNIFANIVRDDIFWVMDTSTFSCEVGTKL